MFRPRAASLPRSSTECLALSLDVDMNSTTAKNFINRIISPLGLEINTTLKRRSAQREFERLNRLNQFNKDIFPLTESMRLSDGSDVRRTIRSGVVEEVNWANLVVRGHNYDLHNPWFYSPDADVYVAIIAEFKPSRIVEVGCGNSTIVARAAIDAFGTSTHLLSIDPQPRRSISEICDVYLQSRVESADADDQIADLRAGDILFVDSSHITATGGDVVHLFLSLLPRLRRGVLIHIHDIFLPFDYPANWFSWGFNEQYLTQALLEGSRDYEVLWASRYFQSIMPDFSSYFPRLGNRFGTSMWLRVAR